MNRNTGVVRVRHPGSSKNKTRLKPRGRLVAPQALVEVRELLADAPRRRDLLIEYLHRIQDRYHCLDAAHLAALAEEMRLPLAEVYAVATFYAHFDVVKEDPAPPAITVRVCDSLSCELAGAAALQAVLAHTLGAEVRVVRAPCMGRCDTAPVIEVGKRHVDHATAKRVAEVIESGDLRPQIPPYRGLGAYREEDNGYCLLAACLAGQRSFEDVAAILDQSGLRGFGGAGFPSGRKWRIVRSHPAPRLVAINADEGEPGTFKDRHYLETDPHRFLEGVLIAAWAMEAADVYIYLRDEYPAVHAILQQEIQQLESAALTGHARLHLRRGAGAYICGEESAMLESIEGKRGLPRQRPPYVAEVGLFHKPTLVHNVETMFWVRDIIENGADWFAKHGRRGGKGLRSYSVSGRVRSPGVKLAPAGITAKELIDEYCDGIAEGHVFRAYLPGGASGGILPASMADLPLEFGQLERFGCFVGSHAVIVLSDHDDLRAVALNLMRFFNDESCGQCTPCRVGTLKAVKLMEAKVWDEALLNDLGAVMSDASICGLGQAAANPLRAVLKHFRDDIGLGDSGSAMAPETS